MKVYYSESSIREKDILELAWNYFQQHANQRISYFNFFVVFSSLLSTGLLTTFQKDLMIHYMGVIFGLLQMILSFIFWKIDDRNKILTKNGENVIKHIEQNLYINNSETYSSKLRLFTTEELETNLLKAAKTPFLFRPLSHSKAFNIIFGLFFIIGCCGMIISISLWLGNTYNVDEQTSSEREIARQIDVINFKLDIISYRLLHILDNIETKEKEGIFINYQECTDVP